MKILISTDTYYPDVNGCSYFTQRLAHYQKLKGHDVAVVAPSQSFKHTDEIKNGVRIFGISSLPTVIYQDFRFARPFLLQSQMENILEDFKPDVIHMQGHLIVNRMMLKAAKKKNIPLVVTNHLMPDNLTHYLPLPKKGITWINEFMWHDLAKVFNQVPFVTTPTEIAANLIRPRLSVPVTSVTCGIDTERFNPRNDGEYMRKRFSIPSDKPVLLFVGRLDAEKKIDEVIRASAQALKKIDFSLVIGGKGKESDNLKKLVHELGISDNVFFTGFISDEDLPSLYKVADCFVNACPYELQCIVVMEAMATGLPIIAVNAGALPHLVQDGVNGSLFPIGDITVLSEKIIDMMGNKEKRDTMGKESLRLITTHGMDTMIDTYLEIYKQAIKSKKGQ